MLEQKRAREEQRQIDEAIKLSLTYVKDKAEFPAFERPQTAAKPKADPEEPEGKKPRNRKKKGQPLEMKLTDWNKIEFGNSKANYAENIFNNK